METKHTASTPPREELHPRLPCTPPCINKTLHSVTSSSEIDNQGRGASTPPLTGEKRGRDFSDGDNESRFVSRVRIDNATSLSSAVLVADTERPERTTNFQKNLSSQQEVEGSKPVGLPLDKQGDDMDDSDDEVYYEVEEYQAAEQQLFAEGASLQIDTGGDHISPEQDDYCISPGWELALGEFDLDACTGSKPMPYKTFSFFMRHEITRISLALGLTPQECSTRVPAVAEQYGHKLHSARTRRKMWEILGALGSDISAAGSNKALPAPPTEEVWSTVKDSKLWSDKIELTGVASFNQSSSNSSGSSPTISLNPPTLSGKMNKFTRSFGSDRFLTLRIPLPNSGASGEAPSLEIARWLAEDELTLMGRRWRCFWAKPGSKKQDKKQDKQLQPAQPGACKQWVQAEYYLRASFFAEGGIGLGETSKDEWSLAPIEGTCRPTIRREMGREDLIRWHIPIDKHMDTPFPKMWSRISLGLSGSIPTVTFGPDQIRDIDDILSPTGKEMNDGCSICTPEVMRMICAELDLDEMPAAVQGRLGGAKGMWFVDPNADRSSKDVTIFVTKSQRKFQRHDIDTEMDWARSTLFVCSYSKEPVEANLNTQLIPILSMQGVPFETFKELLEQHIDHELAALLKATRDKVALRTWLSGKSVASSRKAYGEIPRFTSGTPRSNEEQMTMLLDAGFEPTRCSILMDGLKKVINQECNSVKQRLRIRVPYSTYVYCIADPTHTLEEGEVSLQLSKGFLDPTTKTRWDCIKGEVLVARIPAHLPTDIQKVRAVCPSNESGLRHLKDVIVFSTKGNNPLAGMLSGGDYDGDEPWVCWDPRLVAPFRNNQFFESFDKNEYFHCNNPSLRELPDTDTKMTSFFRLGFESDLRQDYLGKCTNILQKYSYHKIPRDVFDSNMMLFAQLCGEFVDAPKQGLRPKEETVKMLDGWNKKLQIPAYKTPERGGMVKDNPHILDRLVLQVARDAADKGTRQLAKVEKERTWRSDKHLTEQFKRIDSAANKDPPLRQMLINLEKSLQGVCQEWAIANRNHNAENFSAAVETVYPLYKKIKPEPCNDPRIQAWYDNADRPGSEWSLIKASKLFYMKQWPHKLPWFMAMSELCAMKARESSIDFPAPRSVVHDVYFVLKPNPRLLKDKEDEDVDMDD